MNYRAGFRKQRVKPQPGHMVARKADHASGRKGPQGREKQRQASDRQSETKKVGAPR